MTEIGAASSSTSRETIFIITAVREFLFFFYRILFLSANVNPRRRSLARWYTTTEQWKKLSARTVVRWLVDIGDQVDARRACMYLRASEQHWFAAGFDGDDTGVERGFTSTWSRAAESVAIASSGVFCLAFTRPRFPLCLRPDLTVTKTRFTIEESFLFAD